MPHFAVLLDTISIQKYIFSSSKLKDNIGASHLVIQLFSEYLKKALEEVFQLTVDLKQWKKEPEEPDNIQIKDPSIPFEIGYIGGGKALLLFQNNGKDHIPDNKKDQLPDNEKGHIPKKIRDFMKKWTSLLLVEAPGLLTAAACERFDINNFEESCPTVAGDSITYFEGLINTLFNKLDYNKNKYIPQTVIPRHGFTAVCSRSGYSMEFWNESSEDSSYVSSVVMAKIKAAKSANDKINEKYKDVLGNKYCFTDQLEALGHKKGEDSHIAVVHIDGNDMAERFKNMKTLSEFRCLSRDVDDVTNAGFKKLLKEIVTIFPRIKDELGSGVRSEDGREIIPLRPIIIGGDDITFVCNGKLGIYFAKLFLHYFHEAAREKFGNTHLLSACAGIAITKTKYPFYRAYELAEQLCRSAKEKRVQEGGEGSWLDFHIAYGGFSGTLDEIRETHGQAPEGNLIFRPYRLGAHEKYNFNTFIENTKELKAKFPESKIMELRAVLTRGAPNAERFVNEMKARGEIMPAIEGYSYEGKLWESRETPYFDMIELMKVYPSFALDDKGGSD